MGKDDKNKYDFCFYLRAIQELDKRWEKGELDSRVFRLHQFIEKNWRDIRNSLEQKKEEDDIRAAVNQLYISVGAFDLHSDMADQVNEINKEVWIRAEEGNHNHRDIRFDWTLKWAVPWRQWRDMEDLYVIDKKAPEIYRFLASQKSR